MADSGEITCRRCGSQRPAGDYFCGNCGMPLGEPGQVLPGGAAAPSPIRYGDDAPAPVSEQWEEKELTIRLDLDTTDAIWSARFDEILWKRLNHEATNGWRPEGSAEWKDLLDSGAIRRIRRRSARGLLQVAESVTIRLRRRA
jgi:hypothetical protein